MMGGLTDTEISDIYSKVRLRDPQLIFVSTFQHILSLLILLLDILLFVLLVFISRWEIYSWDRSHDENLFTTMHV
jgi:hypothetical protein